MPIRRARYRPGRPLTVPRAKNSGLAVWHRAPEIGSEGVVGADETGRLAPVAGRAGDAVPVQHIDGGGAGLTGQRLQLGADDIGRPPVRTGQQPDDLGVLRQDDGQGAVLLQLAAQDGGVQGGGRIGLARQIGLGVAPRQLVRLPPSPARPRSASPATAPATAARTAPRPCRRVDRRRSSPSANHAEIRTTMPHPWPNFRTNFTSRHTNAN